MSSKSQTMRCRNLKKLVLSCRQIIGFLSRPADWYSYPVAWATVKRALQFPGQYFIDSKAILEKCAVHSPLWVFSTRISSPKGHCTPKPFHKSQLVVGCAVQTDTCISYAVITLTVIHLNVFRLEIWFWSFGKNLLLLCSIVVHLCTYFTLVILGVLW